MVERHTDERLYGSSANGHGNGADGQGSVRYRSSGREAGTTITSSIDSLLSSNTGSGTDKRLYGTSIRREPIRKWRWQTGTPHSWMRALAENRGDDQY